MVRARSETALEKKDKEVLKSTNDYLMGPLACSKRKNRRRKVDAHLYIFADSLLGFALIADSYIAK